MRHPGCSLGAFLGPFGLSWRSLGGCLGLFWSLADVTSGQHGILAKRDIVFLRRPLVAFRGKHDLWSSGFDGVPKITSIRLFTSRPRLAVMVKLCGI